MWSGLFNGDVQREEWEDNSYSGGKLTENLFFSEYKQNNEGIKTTQQYAHEILQLQEISAARLQYNINVKKIHTVVCVLECVTELS